MKKIISIMICICTFSLLGSLNVKAESNSAEEQQKVDFSVSLKYPVNQKDGVKSYFNLDVKPNEKQQLTVNIQNNSDKPIDVMITPTNALNSPQGGIVYKEQRKDDFSYLTDPEFYMDGRIQVKDTVHLKPKQNKDVPVNITVPNIEKGSALGGLLFEQVHKVKGSLVNKEEEVSLAGNIKLKQAIAIQLNVSEVESTKLNIDDVNNGIYPTGAFIHFGLENSSPAIVKNVSFDYEIEGKNGESFKGKIPEFNVAPKVKVKIQIPWGSKEYKPGDYKLILKPSFSEQSIIKELHVKKKDVKVFAEKTGQDVQIAILDNMPVWSWILLILLLVGAIYGSYKMGQRKTERKEQSKAA